MNLKQNALGYVSIGSNVYGTATDGGMLKQYYSSVWGFDLYLDYRTGLMQSRGLNNGTYTAWKFVGNMYGVVSGTTLTITI